MENFANRCTKRDTTYATTTPSPAQNAGEGVVVALSIDVANHARRREKEIVGLRPNAPAAVNLLESFQSNGIGAHS